LAIGLYVWYWLSSILLAFILYRPVKKIIFVGRVRRLEKKLKRASTEEERRFIEKKTVYIVTIIVITFSFLFNKIIMGKYIVPK